MYSLVIADDEVIIQEGLKSYDWERLGFKVVHICEDGTGVLEFLECRDVDVILTDINMPMMDGLTLCKNIRLKGYKTKIVFLSGYQDFEYAREAIKYGVVDYLLKPIQLSKLNELFSSIKKALDQEMLLNKKVEDDYIYTQKQIVKEIIYNPLNQILDVKNKTKKITFLRENICYGVMVLSNIEKNTEAFVDGLGKICIHMDRIFYIEEAYSKSLVLLCVKEDVHINIIDLYKYYRLRLNAFIDTYNNQYGTKMDGFLGEFHMDMVGIHQSFKSAKMQESVYIESHKMEESLAINPTIEFIKNYLKKNYMNKISLESIAELVNMNPNYLSTLIKSELGKNYKEYLVSIRLDKAKELLKSVDLRISAVSEMVGYQNSKYFTDLFKKHEGISPTHYRKIHIGDKNENE